MKETDVLIIGAGAVGCAIARELSRFEISIAVLEKECDVAAGTSGRNSAVVHAGFNNQPGSLMAKLCVEGNRGFEALCSKLDIPYKKTGKVLTALDEADLEILRGLIAKGEKNGCEALRLINENELHILAPGLDGIGGMYSPNTAIFDPFLYCVALAENAWSNGVSFYFDTPVSAIEKRERSFFVSAGGERFSCRILINSAGLYSDEISSMAGVKGYHIYPCRGEYYILDKVAHKLPIPAYPAPKPGIGGLGVHITPTINGNLIIGPSAEYIDDKEDYACTAGVMEKLLNEAAQLLPTIEKKDIIGNYAGIRPKQAPPGEGGFRDFIIREEEECPGLVNLIGIESPGLTASVPIAKMVSDIVGRRILLEEKKSFIEERKGIPRFRELTRSEQKELIAKDPDYGEIICRCQNITKAEIRQAIENPLGVRTVSAIKYRAWPTTGRCGGGFCLPRISELLINEFGISPDEITYRGKGGEYFVGAKNC